MPASQRISPLDFDVAPDEELPGYEASTAPAYDSGTYDEPLVTYLLRQYDRKIQVLGTYGTHAPSSYRITTNGFRLFSKKKPEMEVLYTSQEMRQRSIASISFDNDSPLPWRPRAHFDHVGSDGLDTTYNMESKNFVDWMFALGDRMYAWSLDRQPVSLVLTETHSTLVIARFTYSTEGTSAARGEEVGELIIYRDGLTLERDGIDKLVCGLIVALTYFKKMGKFYTNGATELERVGFLRREISPLYRASLAGAPTL